MINMPGTLQVGLDLSSSLSGLEERVAVLEKDFNSMMQTADALLRATERYVDKQETERMCWKLLDSIFEAGTDSKDIVDHVRVFFQFILSQMKLMGADILDVKMLWHLHDNEDVKSTFFTAVNHFGFGQTDLPSLKVLLALIYKVQTDNENDSALNENNVDTVDDTQQLYDRVDGAITETFGKMVGNFVDNSFKEALKAMSNCSSLTSSMLNTDTDKLDVEYLDKSMHTAKKSNVNIEDETHDFIIDQPSLDDNFDYERNNREKEMDSTKGKSENKSSECMTHDDQTRDSNPRYVGNKHMQDSRSKVEDVNKAGSGFPEDSEKKIDDGDCKVAKLNQSLEQAEVDICSNTTKVLRTAKPKCDSTSVTDKRRFRKILHAWEIDDNMRKTVTKIIYTVFWMLNVGRKAKDLTIIPKQKL